MRYVPYQSLTGEPNIIVGGRATAGTVLHFSHASFTRYRDGADLHLEMTFQFLRQSEKSERAELVSSDSFNVDNLAAVFALTNNPEAWQDLSDQLIAVAKAALFEKGQDQNTQRIAFVLSAWQDPEKSPLNQTIFAGPAAQVTTVLYEELLPRLPKIIHKVDYLERYWVEQEDQFQATEARIEAGSIVLTELKELDLVIAESEGNFEPHSVPVHNRSDCSRVMLLSDHEHVFYYRLESSMEYGQMLKCSPRIDLAGLAKQLTNHEPKGSFWLFEPIDSGKPYLRLVSDRPSLIKKEAFKSALLDVLSNVVTGPPSF
jgi:hypothetical protein